MSFSASPADRVFSDALYVFTTDRWDLYSIVQSTIHEVWARKYSGSLETRLRYSPSDCFSTFAFPEGLWEGANPTLAELGERYHEHRRQTMLRLWLGLTDTYNLFHAHDLKDRIAALYVKRAKSDAWRSDIPAEHQATAGSLTEDEAVAAIEQLRRLHVELDQAVLTAYGWTGLNLGHDFHDVDYLPENDRTRYTISPAARKDLLQRLLKLNHERHAQEMAGDLVHKGKKAKAAVKMQLAKQAARDPMDVVIEFVGVALSAPHAPVKLSELAGAAALSLNVGQLRGLAGRSLNNDFLTDAIREVGIAKALEFLHQHESLAVEGDGADPWLSLVGDPPDPDPMIQEDVALLIETERMVPQQIEEDERQSLLAALST